MFCTQCGKSNPDDARFCAACGKEIQPPAASAPPQPLPDQTPAPVSAPTPVGAAPPAAATPAAPLVVTGAPHAPPADSPAPPMMLRQEVAPVYVPPPPTPPPAGWSSAPAPPVPAPGGAPPAYPPVAYPPPGYPAPAGPPGGVGFSFWGTGWQCLGWGLLYAFLASTWIGTAWGLEFLYKWLLSKLRLSDNTAIQFVGTGAQIWWVPIVGTLPLMVANLFSALPALASQIRVDEDLQRLLATGGVVVTIVLMIPGILVMCWMVVRILKWVLENLVLSCGTRLTFTGTLWQYLGWFLLMWISVYSIIGWAWVAVAMVRWMFRNTWSSGGHRLVFTGTGGEVLWRYLVMGLVILVTLGLASPWMVVWFLRWAASRTFVVPGAMA